MIQAHKMKDQKLKIPLIEIYYWVISSIIVIIECVFGGYLMNQDNEIILWMWGGLCVSLMAWHAVATVKGKYTHNLFVLEGKPRKRYYPFVDIRLLIKSIDEGSLVVPCCEYKYLQSEKRMEYYGFIPILLFALVFWVWICVKT